MSELDFSQVSWEELGNSTLETLQMLGASALFTLVIGLPLGILLFLASRSSLTLMKVIYIVLSFIVNILRSVPFIILIVALIPFTRSLVGTSTGVLGTIPPLVIGLLLSSHVLSKRHYVKWTRVSLKLHKRWGLRQDKLSSVCCYAKHCPACSPH